MNSLGDVLEELVKRKARLKGATGDHNDFYDGTINGYANSIHLITLAIEGHKELDGVTVTGEPGELIFYSPEQVDEYKRRAVK